MHTITRIPTPVQQCQEAVKQARLHRHHPDCRCHMVRQNGSPYCSDGEATWSSILDRLIDRVLETSRR